VVNLRCVSISIGFEINSKQLYVEVVEAAFLLYMFFDLC